MESLQLSFSYNKKFEHNYYQPLDPISEIREMRMTERAKCMECNFTNEQEIRHTEIILSIPDSGKSFLKNLVVKSFTSKRIQMCSTCDRDVNHSIKLLLNTAPQILFLHLKRPSYNGLAFKNSNHINIDEILRLPNIR